MRREEIIRDFPTARRGYETSAVDAHLRRVAEEVGQAGKSSLADAAAERVVRIVQAAEETAEEIEADARHEANQLLADARAQARDQIERAQRSVANLVGQADELQQRISAMVEDVGGESGLDTEPVAEHSEMPQPEPVPEPAPEPVPEPAPPQPEVDPTPVIVPEPAPPTEPEPGPATIPEPQPEPPAPAAVSSGDEQAARLVAMKMALDGSSREEIARHLSANYQLSGADNLLDAVFERAGR